MSIDTSILLRIRDRPLFRRLVEAFAEARRCDGDDGWPTLWPLDDGSVIVGTVIRWDDRGMELEAREFLTSLTAGRLAEVHDDPRGVYLCTDVALPRRRTYEGAVAELGGRFVQPAPPSEEELAARDAASSVAGDRATILYEAILTGNADAFVSALASSSESQRAFMTRQWGYSHPDKPLPALPDPAIPEPAEAAPKPPLPPPATPAIAVPMTPAKEDGAVSVLLPSPVAQLVDRGAVPSFAEDARRIGLEDGGAIYITSWGGDAVVAAAWLGAACIRAGIDRARVGPCAFFGESLARELEAAGVKTASEALGALGDRAEMLSLLNREERARENVALARAWLAEKG